MMMETNIEKMDCLDPCPDIHSLFSLYNDLYFGGKLGACSVEWSSKRMTLCAGVCSYTPRGGCVIKLSEPLLKLRPTKDLKETLLHEMIHAYQFLMKIRDNDKSGHGDKFKEKMNYINTASFPDPQRPPSGYHVTVFHAFHDEVENYRVHWWECDKCHRVVKRAMNRAPQNADCPYRRPEKDPSCGCIHHLHVRNCGGKFLKIKEPEPSNKKQPKQADKGQKLITEYSPAMKDAHSERRTQATGEEPSNNTLFPGKPRYLGKEPKSYFPGSAAAVSTRSQPLWSHNLSNGTPEGATSTKIESLGTLTDAVSKPVSRKETKRKMEEAEVVDLLEHKGGSNDQLVHKKRLRPSQTPNGFDMLEARDNHKPNTMLPSRIEVIDLTDILDSD